MRLVNKLTLSLLIIGAAAFALTAETVSAQVYPPADADISVEVSDADPDPGASVEVKARITDASGQGVADTEVEFTITSNPGGAAFSNGEQSITATTDADGFATVSLETGDDPGTIVVLAEGAGQVSQVTVTTGSPQALPPSGGIPAESAGGVPLTALAAGAVGIALLAVVAAFGWWMLASAASRRPPDRYSI